MQLLSKLSPKCIGTLCATVKKVKAESAVSCVIAKLKDEREGKVQEGDDDDNVLVPGVVSL